MPPDLGKNNIGQNLFQADHVKMMLQITLQQPVHQQIGIPPDRTGEMTVSRRRQSKMPNMKRSIFRLLQAAKNIHIHGIRMFLALDRRQQILDRRPVQLTRNLQPADLDKPAFAFGYPYFGIRMNSPHKRNVKSIQQSSNRFVRLHHEHLDHRMRIAIVGGFGIDNGTVIVKNKLSLRQFQVKHPFLCPSFLNRLCQCFHILEQRNNLARKTFSLTLKDTVCLKIRQPRLRTDNTVGVFPVDDLRIVVVSNINALCKPLLIRLQAAYSVTENLRQHRDNLAGQINAVTPVLRFDIQRRIHRNKSTHVGDMNPQYPVAVFVSPQTYRIVKILRIRRIDRNDRFVGYIVTLFPSRWSKTRRCLPCLLETIFIESTRQTMLSNCRHNLGLIKSRFSENLQYHSAS